MRFDFLSFLLGVVVTAILSAILFRFRGRITGARSSAQSQAGTTRRFLSNSAESRYADEIGKLANAYHVAGDTVALSEIFVEPRFIPAVTPLDLDESARIGSIFHVVPIIHDLSAIYSAYNIPTLSIIDLRAGDRHLAILGLPGMGKSTALALMALYAGGNIELQSLDSLAEQVQADEDQDLTDQERAQRQQVRKEQQERALEQLRVSKERESIAKEKQNIEVRESIDFQTLMPLLVNIRDIDLTPESYGEKKALDSAEPLVKAIMAQLGSIAAQAAPRVIYGKLAAGQCMVLLDGFDEIGASLWPEKLVWLAHFMADYSANVIVVAGPATGFDPLVNLGFTPLYVRPFSDADYETLTGRWAAAWPRIAGTRRHPAAPPDEKVIRRVGSGNRGRTPLDVTLKTLAAFRGDEQELGRRGAYDAFIRSHGAADQQSRTLLALVAGRTLDDGTGLIKREAIKELITPSMTGADGKVAGNPAEVADKLANNQQLMVSAPGDQVAFRHPLLAGFLAAESLREAPKERIAAIALKHAWQDALPFAAAMTSLDAAVLARFSAAPDVLFSTMFDIANWLPDAPADAPWRAELFKRYGAAMGGPSQFPLVRDRAAAALVTTRDKGVSFVFRQALKSPDANVRRLGCIGLGALGDPEVIKDLQPMLADADADVELAAGLALGALNSEHAVEVMVEALFEGEESLRRAVAETLAAIPGTGHSVLRESIGSSDMLVRRATVFGLSRVNAPWALALLYRALLEDAQWYVRSAAEQAFREAETPQGDGPTMHPDAANLTWLIEWAATKGEGVPSGPNARQMLVRALQEGEPLHRGAAALTIGYLGYVPALKPLYNALRDSDENVRGTVYEALGTMQQRLGKPLPAVV